MNQRFKEGIKVVWNQALLAEHPVQDGQSAFIARCGEGPFLVRKVKPLTCNCGKNAKSPHQHKKGQCLIYGRSHEDLVIETRVKRDHVFLSKWFVPV